MAQAIVDYRDANGTFRSRQVLRKVPRLGPEAFEQAAAFLRVREGENPMDAIERNKACWPENPASPMLKP